MSRPNFPAIILAALLIASCSIWFKFFYLSKKALPDYPLAGYLVTLRESPYEAGRDKTATNGYDFRSIEYPCTFQLTRGAFDLIDRNMYLRDAILSLKAGDTVAVLLRHSAAYALHANGEVPVMGLSYKGEQWLSAEEVYRANLRRQGKNYLFVLSVLIVILVIRGFRRKR